MVGEPRSGLLAEDDQESDEFLCGVAVECVNDALLVLGHVDTTAKAVLRDALAILVDQATVSSSALGPWQVLQLEPGSGADARLSPRAKQVIRTHVDRMAGGNPAIAQSADKPEFAAARRRAVPLLMEALSLLGSAGDVGIASQVQIAIDRAGRENGPRPDELSVRPRS